MKWEEFLVIVKVLKSAYANTYFLPDNESVRVWYHSLKDIPYELLKITVYQYMATHKFPPTIAELREVTFETTNKNLGWANGWQQVIKAISKYGTNDVTGALNSMDELTRKTVEHIGFKEIGMSTNLAVERANFRMIYEQLQQRQKEDALIPIAIKNKVSEMLESMSYKQLEERED